MSPLLLLGVLCVVWCVLHSLLINPRVDEWLRSRLGSGYVFTRLGYVVFSSISVLALLIYARSLPSRMIFPFEGIMAVVRWLGLALAIMIFFVAARGYDHHYFFGFRQALAHRTGREPALPAFSRRGIHEWMRHPYYSATLLVLVFMGDVTDVGLVWRGIFFVYTIVGTWLEERKLLVFYGEEYARYRRQVPMFVPWRGGGRW